MKKITLSAAIMALAMMGCSDAGLDNSVASTSEIKSEQVQSSANEPLVLARSGVVSYADEPLTGGNFENNHNGYERYAYNTTLGFIQVQMQSYHDGVNAVAAYHVMNYPSYPSYIRVVMLPLYHCAWDGNHKPVCNFPGSKPNTKYIKSEMVRYTNNITVVAPELVHQSQANVNDLAVVSYFEAVWNDGRPDRVTLKAKTYNGYRLQNNSELAQAVYDKYLKPYAENN